MKTKAGILIVKALKQRGWSQDDLSCVMGRPQKTISLIINGKKRITAETALQLQAALKLPAMKLLKLDNERQLALLKGM